MSQITDFYLHSGPDHIGRTLKDYLNFNYDQLEGIHDYIQWMFPLNAPSNYNELAPILIKDDVKTIIDGGGQKNIIESFNLFFDFLLENRSWVYSVPNHNWLRISRVIQSLRLFDLDTTARNFHSTNMMLMKNPEADSVSYWVEALIKDLWTS